jgi:GNAT superfamily N-acetyltransferase
VPAFRDYLKQPNSDPKPEQYLLRALRTSSGQMIGNTALFNFTVPENDETSPMEDRGKVKWEIAYDLDPDYWGKGLGRGMIEFLVNWAGWLGLDAITAVSCSRYRLASRPVTNDIESCYCQRCFSGGTESQWVRNNVYENGKDARGQRRIRIGI